MFGQVCISETCTHTGIQRMAASSHTYISFNTYSGTCISRNETCLCLYVHAESLSLQKIKSCSTHWTTIQLHMFTNVHIASNDEHIIANHP